MDSSCAIMAARYACEHNGNHQTILSQSVMCTLLFGYKMSQNRQETYIKGKSNAMCRADYSQDMRTSTIASRSFSVTDRPHWVFTEICRLM